VAGAARVVEGAGVVVVASQAPAPVAIVSAPSAEKLSHM
jgi:hypothetical protein